ncbi:MAG TPA: N-acetyltransferase [Gammaproteobacteria bacterium]|nr:N-acetyltransferase [Gammaproteobacteria bacterium]
MDTNIEFRAAQPADARAIAELVDISSDGVARIEWVEEARQASGTDPLDIGARVYADGNGDYSYRNCVIAEDAGKVAGMLLTFAMPPADPLHKAAAPPFDGSDVFAPYKYLEAPETWYICGVALYPDYRGRGIGSKLLEVARSQGSEQGFGQLSLVAFEQNRGAVRLYRRLGYREIARAPIVPHPLIRCTGDALLMVADT